MGLAKSRAPPWLACGGMCGLNLAELRVCLWQNSGCACGSTPDLVTWCWTISLVLDMLSLPLQKMIVAELRSSLSPLPSFIT